MRTVWLPWMYGGGRGRGTDHGAAVHPAGRCWSSDESGHIVGETCGALGMVGRPGAAEVEDGVGETAEGVGGAHAIGGGADVRPRDEVTEGGRHRGEASGGSGTGKGGGVADSECNNAL